MIVYRIENCKGEGPFFDKHGKPKDGAPINNKVGMYAFRRERCFLRSDYYLYYEDPHYILYKLIIKKPLEIYLFNGEVRFLESDIIFKIPINKKFIKEKKSWKLGKLFLKF